VTIVQRLISAVVASLLVATAFGARAADLVVWWEKGFYAQEDEALEEIIAAFEQKTGKQVELIFHEPAEAPDKIVAALKADQPPDFAFNLRISLYFLKWVLDGRLLDLSDTVGNFSNLFDPEALARLRVRDAATGQKALYGLPIGRSTNYLHVWRSLLERSGLTLAEIPKQWDAFWSFWCDKVQPAVRRTAGRGDIWGIALNMSGEAPGETDVQFAQFMDAYQADYVTRDGRLVIDDPEVRQKLIKAIDSYTAIYRKGCTPPDSVSWNNSDNNKQFLAQTVVMTPNETLSIPNAVKRERPDDYIRNVATVEWPLGPNGNAFPIGGDLYFAVVFKEGGHVATTKEFVRFLVAEGWLAHYLDFSAERFLPPMPSLIDSPFWLDPSDPHRMAGAMQISSRPMEYDYQSVTGDWRYGRIWQEHVWARAIHRVVTEGISPEQAVDEAIARIKQILAE
jgi:multiple sugar transport system substrate-binding protein